MPNIIGIWREGRSVQMPSNKFEVLKDRVMHRGERSGRGTAKDRKGILREQRAKREQKYDKKKWKGSRKEEKRKRRC